MSTPTASEEVEDTGLPPTTGPVCGICVNPLLAGERVTESPACPCKYHSACALPFVAHRFSDYYSHIHCPACYTVLYALPPPSDSNSIATYNETSEEFEARMTALKENPQFRRQLAVAKTKLTAARKASVAFRKHAVAMARGWRLEIAPHIQAIRELKRGALAATRGHESYRAARSAMAAWQRSMTVLRMKYNLRVRGLNYFFAGSAGRRFSRPHLYMHVLHRAFRLPWNIV
jgi:hypothetical protein